MLRILRDPTYYLALRQRLAELGLPLPEPGAVTHPGGVDDVYVPDVRGNWSRGRYMGRRFAPPWAKAHPRVPTWMTAKPVPVNIHELSEMENFFQYHFITADRYFAWLEASFPAFVVAEGQFQRRWWQPRLPKNPIRDARFVQCAIILSSHISRPAKMKDAAGKLSTLVPFVFREEERRSCYNHLSCLYAISLLPRNCARVTLACDLISRLAGDHGWVQVSFILWAMLLHPYPHAYHEIMRDHVNTKEGRRVLLSSAKDVHISLSRSEMWKKEYLDVAKLCSLTYMHFAAGRRWEGDTMADQEDRTQDKDAMYSALGDNGEYSSARFYEMSAIYLQEIFCLLRDAHSYEYTIDQYWAQRVRKVAKGHATGARGIAPVVRPVREIAAAVDSLMDMLTPYVGIDVTHRLREAIAERRVLNVEKEICTPSTPYLDSWPRPNRCGLACGFPRDAQFSGPGFTLRWCPRCETPDELAQAKKIWRFFTTGVQSVLNDSREVVVRLKKPAWADLETCSSMAERMQQTPSMQATQFQKNEVANGRVLTAVDPMANEIARYVLGSEDKHLMRTKLTDGGIGPAETIVLRHQRVERMKELLKSGHFISLCSDYANFQNGHSLQLMQLHWQVRAEMSAAPNTAAGADWRRACAWVHAALRNCTARNASTGETFKIASSLLSGFADTNGVNTRANISELLMALSETALLAPSLRHLTCDLDRITCCGLGDDSMFMSSSPLVTALVLLCLMAHGRPMVEAKQSISRRYLDYLRLKITPSGCYGHLLRKLGTTISEDWEGLATPDIASKIRSVLEQLATLTRRGANGHQVDLMLRCAVSHFTTSSTTQHTLIELFTILWSPNGAMRCNLWPQRDVWCNKGIAIPPRVLGRPRLSALPGRGSADFTLRLVTNLRSLGMHVDEKVQSALAAHVHLSATEGSRHETELDIPSRVMWTKWKDVLADLDTEEIPARMLSISASGLAQPPVVTLWLGPALCGKTVNCGCLVRDGDDITGPFPPCLVTGACLTLWRNIVLNAEPGAAYFTRWCPRCYDLVYLDRLLSDAKRVLLGRIVPYGASSDVSRDDPWLTTAAQATMVPSPTQAIRFASPCITVPSSIGIDQVDRCAQVALSAVQALERCCRLNLSYIDRKEESYFSSHPLYDDGLRAAYCAASGIPEDEVLDMVMSTDATKLAQGYYLALRSAGMRPKAAFDLSHWKISLSAAVSARYGCNGASNLARYLTTTLLGSEHGFPLLDKAEISRYDRRLLEQYTCILDRCLCALAIYYTPLCLLDSV